MGFLLDIGRGGALRAPPPVCLCRLLLLRLLRPDADQVHGDLPEILQLLAVGLQVQRDRQLVQLGLQRRQFSFIFLKLNHGTHTLTLHIVGTIIPEKPRPVKRNLEKATVSMDFFSSAVMTFKVTRTMRIGSSLLSCKIKGSG